MKIGAYKANKSKQKVESSKKAHKIDSLEGFSKEVKGSKKKVEFSEKDFEKSKKSYSKVTSKYNRNTLKGKKLFSKDSKKLKGLKSLKEVRKEFKKFKEGAKSKSEGVKKFSDKKDSKVPPTGGGCPTCSKSSFK